MKNKQERLRWHIYRAKDGGEHQSPGGLVAVN